MSSSLNPAIYVQIRNLVQGLVNKKSVRNAKAELLSIVEMTGIEAEKYMFICLFEGIDFKDAKIMNGSKDQSKTQFLVQCLTTCSSHSSFLDYFSQVIETTCQKQGIADYTNDVIKCLKLALSMQLIIAISLYLSQNKQVSRDGLFLFKQKLIEYSKLGKPLQFPEHALSILLYTLKSSPDFDDLKEEVKFLVEANSQERPFESAPLLIKNIENQHVEEGNTLDTIVENTVTQPVKVWEVLRDLGPTCTQSLQNIKQILSDFAAFDEEDILQSFLMMANNSQEIEDQNTRTINNVYHAIKTKSRNQVVEDSSDKKTNVIWNVDNFLRACLDKLPNVKWSQVIQKLDRPYLYFKEPKSLVLLFKVFKKMQKLNNFQFPANVVFGQWKNPLSQAIFLVNYIQAAQPEVLFYNEIQKKTVVLPKSSNIQINNLNPVMLQFFGCVEILELLVDLSETDYFIEIRNLFDTPITKCPDLLLFGLMQIQSKHGYQIVEELYSQLLPIYLSNPTHSPEILETIWSQKPELISLYFSGLFEQDRSQSTLLRAIEISQILKDSLSSILNSRNNLFAVNLAILAAKKNLIQLDQWINKRFQVVGDPLILAFCNYFEDSLVTPCKDSPADQKAILEKSQLSIDGLVKLFQVLSHQSIEEKASIGTKQALNETLRRVGEYFSEVESQISWPEIEAEANKLFEQAFEEKITIADLTAKMISYKNSNTKRETDLFLCMMSNLLDEARFFSNYKHKILAIMGQIYGTVIQNNLIEGQVRDVAFKIIIEALKNKDDKKFIDFGVKALEVFKGRLYEWPTKAVQLFSIEGVWDKHYPLLEEIRSNLENKNVPIEIPANYASFVEAKNQEKKQMAAKMNAQIAPPSKVGQDSNLAAETFDDGTPKDQDNNLRNKRFSNSRIEEISMNFGNMTINSSLLSQSPLIPTTNSVPTSQTPDTPSESSTATRPNERATRSSQPVNMDTFLRALDKEFVDLSPDLKSKVIFSLNNCSNTNIDEKSIEIRKQLNDETVLKWFSKYIVYQRAPVESNFHTMYISLIEKTGKQEIFKIMTKETYHVLNRLLESDKGSSGSERSFQGSDKNILKNLGSWLGQLTIARNKPIIMKEFDIKAIVFDAYENQKLDYVLPLICKILVHGNQPGSVFKPKNAWMSSILSILTEISLMPEIKMALKCEIQVLLNNLGINEGEIMPSKAIQARMIQKRNLKASDSSELNGKLGKNVLGPEGQLTINELPQYVNIDSRLLEGINLPNLKTIVAQALDKAIKEILPPVISRSVTIALITTKELVLKDFAIEPDEKKLMRGAHLVVQNLAGNLALVTCREPLKMAFQQNLTMVLEEVEIDKKIKQEIIHSTNVDNLDLGCALIKKAVIEKALEEVNQDPVIIEAIEKRKLANAKGVAFYDENVIKIYQSLPMSLRPTLGGITRDQMGIYEEFGRFARNQGAGRDTRSAAFDGRFERRLDSEGLMVVQKFEQYIMQLDKELTTLAEQQNQEKIKELQVMYKRVMEMVSSSPNREDVVLECSTKLLDPLFTDQISFKKINFFLAILRELRGLNESLPSFLLQWILLPTEKRILKLEIILKLIKENFLVTGELDQGFSDLLDTSSNNVHIYLSITKIVKSLTVDEKILPAVVFQKTISLILKSIKNFKDIYPKMGKYLEDFKNALNEVAESTNTNGISYQPSTDNVYRNTLSRALALFDAKESAHYEQAFSKLEEWLRITSEKEMPNFIKVLETTIFQGQEDKLTKFFAFMTDICVEHALDSLERIKTHPKIAHSAAIDLSYVDAFSKLIIVILKTVINTDKNEILERILESSVLSLTKNHGVHKENFNQRPFFRLFYNLIFDIQRKEYNFSQEEIMQFMAIFMKIFNTLQPLRYPGFAFAWLQLVSNRIFMPLILATTENKTENWQNYCELIVSLFRFFRETIESDIYKSDFYKLFYNGTLRALLVILHDFPEFLIEAGFLLIENLPEKFGQIRNIILSAFPKSILPPDPFHVSPEIEAHPDFAALPNNLFNIDERIVYVKLHEEIVKYLSDKNELNEIYFRNICSKLLIKDENGEIRINYLVVNAFVLFIPTMIYKGNHEAEKIKEWKADSYDLFMKLLGSSNPVMREALLNAIMNQIRYPNMITFYFTGLIFYIFSRQTDESLLEQIIRIFIQRLIVERPRPWGVIYAFVELIKKKDIFRKKSFFRNPELEEMINYVFEVMGKGEEGAES